MAEQHVDWRGTPIEVGSTVIYPVQQGSSSASVREGVVLEFIGKERPSYLSWGPEETWQARIQVSRSSDDLEGKPEPLKRPTVVYLGNLTVIS